MDKFRIALIGYGNVGKAFMDATSSYVTIDTDLMGATTVIEEPFEPEIDHTAYGVLSDLLRILKKIS